jgi:hypothetical protein
MFSDFGAALAQVIDALLHRHADGAGGEVDDRPVPHLGANGLRDGHVVLDLEARRAVGLARVDVDHHAPLVHDPPRLGGVLGGGIRDRGALLAVGQYAGDRAGENYGVVDAHEEPPCRVRM